MKRRKVLTHAKIDRAITAMVELIETGEADDALADIDRACDAVRGLHSRAVR